VTTVSGSISTEVEGQAAAGEVDVAATAAVVATEEDVEVA